MRVWWTLYSRLGRPTAHLYVDHPNAIERWDKIVSAVREVVQADVASVLVGKRGQDAKRRPLELPVVAVPLP